MVLAQAVLNLITAVVPIYTIIILGFLSTKINWFKPEHSAPLNAAVFRFALPGLFISILSDPTTNIKWNFIAAMAIWRLGGGLLVALGVAIFRKPLGVFLIIFITMTWTNDVAIGLPLLAALKLGPQAKIWPVLSGLTVAMYTPFVQFMLEVFVIQEEMRKEEKQPLTSGIVPRLPIVQAMTTSTTPESSVEGPLSESTAPEEYTDYLLVGMKSGSLHMSHAESILAASNPRRRMLSWATIKPILFGVATNPIVWSVPISMVIRLAHWKLPVIIKNILHFCGESFVFMSLFSMGLSVSQGLGLNKQNGVYVAVLIFCKLVITPLFMGLIVIALKLGAEEAKSAIVISGVASGISGFTVCKQFGLYTHVAQACVILTTILMFANETAILALVNDLPYFKHLPNTTSPSAPAPPPMGSWFGY